MPRRRDALGSALSMHISIMVPGNIFNTVLLDLCKKARVSRLLLGFLSLLNRKSFYRATLKELKGGGCLRTPLFSIMQKSSGASFIAQLRGVGSALKHLYTSCLRLVWQHARKQVRDGALVNDKCASKSQTTKVVFTLSHQMFFLLWSVAVDAAHLNGGHTCLAFTTSLLITFRTPTMRLFFRCSLFCQFLIFFKCVSSFCSSHVRAKTFNGRRHPEQSKNINS